MDTYHDGGDNREELSAQKEKFEKQLSEAIDKPLTLENTDTYVDGALGAVIKLVDNVVAKYDAQPGAEWQQLGEANGKNMRTRRLSTLDWRMWKLSSGIWRIKLVNLR